MANFINKKKFKKNLRLLLVTRNFLSLDLDMMENYDGRRFIIHTHTHTHNHYHQSIKSIIKTNKQTNKQK